MSKLFIRARRKALGMTQEDLAAKAGVERTHISKLEGGKGGYTGATLEALAGSLQCTVGDLFRDPEVGADIVSIWDHIAPKDRDQARAVLQAFTRKETGS